MFICGILCVLCLNVRYTLQILGNYTSQPLNRLNFHTSTKFCGCDTILQTFAKFCITTLNLASLLQISAYPIFQMVPPYRVSQKCSSQLALPGVSNDPDIAGPTDLSTSSTHRYSSISDCPQSPKSDSSSSATPRGPYRDLKISLTKQGKVHAEGTPSGSHLAIVKSTDCVVQLGVGQRRSTFSQTMFFSKYSTCAEWMNLDAPSTPHGNGTDWRRCAEDGDISYLRLHAVST